MDRHSTVKAILGYDIVDGVSIDDYERWIWEVHVPDLLANPHLDKLVFNTVVRPITATSSGSATAEEPETFYRIAELQFASHAAYERYLDWFKEHPIPPERGPAGRTTFRFYVLTDSVEATRNT
ncbi:MAG: hypothetical protein M3132_02765 [Actinomycetia bacterium]|nr:hypothetical protein [Actinomycetes bacterium]